MKIVPFISFIAALAAFLVLPIRFEVATAVLFGLGFFGVVIADYSRPVRPLRVAGGLGASVRGRRERFGLAA